MKNSARVALIAIGLICSTCSYGQTDSSVFGILTSADAEKRQAKIESLGRQRQEIIRGAVSVLNGNYSDEIKNDAAKLSGGYRATEAVDALVKNIALDSKPKILKGLLTEDELHPVTTALIKIGNPSIPALMRNLAESDDAKVRELSLQVLLHIEGDKDIVQLRLQKASKTETSAQKQARLESALKSLADMTFGK